MLRFIAVIFGIYGAYSLIAGYQAGYWLYVASGIVSFLAAIALWMKRSWSKYLVYLIAGLFTASWLWAIWNVWKQGWPYKGVLQSVISLVPGVLMIVVALGSIVLVHKAFTRKR